MGVGFGRLVVDGVVHDDPYPSELEDLTFFEVISDAGPRYRVERSGSRRRRVWHVSRLDPLPAIPIGTVFRCGSFLNRWYPYWFEGRVLSSGGQNILMNAVFGLIGEQEDEVESR